MSQPQHRNDLAHVGLVPIGQLASGTPTSGMVPTYSGLLGAAWAFAGGWASNPMTTQDDIIVGGVPSGGIAPPVRLGKGSDGQVLTVDPTTHHLLWAAPSGGYGASLPAQPAYGNNIPFFYSAAGYSEWVAYDGTRWLCNTEHLLPLTIIGGAAAQPWSATDALRGRVPTQFMLTIWIAAWQLDYLVNTTNDVTRYWNFQLQDNVSGTNIGSAVTSLGQTADAWHANGTTIGASSTYTSLRLLFTKTSTPGTIYALATVMYRHVAT